MGLRLVFRPAPHGADRCCDHQSGWVWTCRASRGRLFAIGCYDRRDLVRGDGDRWRPGRRRAGRPRPVPRRHLDRGRHDQPALADRHRAAAPPPGWGSQRRRESRHGQIVNRTRRIRVGPTVGPMDATATARTFFDPCAAALHDCDAARIADHYAVPALIEFPRPAHPRRRPGPDRGLLR